MWVTALLDYIFRGRSERDARRAHDEEVDLDDEDEEEDEEDEEAPEQ